MNRTFKFLLAASAAALLAACGGGGGGGTETSTQGNSSNNNNPSAPSTAHIANAGIYVPSGASAISLNLTNCTYYNNSSSLGTPANQATLAINSNGDMTFVYPAQPTGVPTVNRTNILAGSSDALISVSRRTGDGADRYTGYVTEDNHTIDFAFNPALSTWTTAPANSAHKVTYSTPSGASYECTFTSGSSISADFGDFNARIARITSGVTTTNQNVAASLNNPQVVLANGIATWINNDYDANGIAARLNLSTGEISTSSLLNGSYTPVNIRANINSNDFPSYSEQRFSNTLSINIAGATSDIDNVRFTVYGGNDLVPEAVYD
ncbi:MAG: hypothetical protein HC765_05265 [Brachymonas sp.]|nr:hypothetical protein [Brachymonas sp.]